MYLFKTKADSSDIDVPVMRSLSGFAFIIALLYKNQHNPKMNIIVAVILLAAFFSTAAFLVRFKVNPLLFAGIAAVLLFLGTHALIFSVLLFVIAVVIKAAYVQPIAEFDDVEIRIKKTFLSKTYAWESFNNVILKDNLLTLDFKNNKVLQLELDSNVKPDEKQFNDYCNKKINRNAD